MFVNKEKFNSIMVLKGDTQEKLAGAIGISRTALNSKINERNAVFTQKEISDIAKRYKLSKKEITDIFFDEFVS